ncbi:MAG: FG-GAP-like repeat-containing protein [Gemmatimonadota bacterium]
MRSPLCILWRVSIGLVLGLGVAGCEERPRAPETPSRELLTIRTLGLAYLEENELAEAEAEFLKLTQLAPDEALGYANLGLAYLRMGRYGEAEGQVRRARDLRPADPDIRLLLAEVYRLTDRRDSARRELERALEETPNHVKSLYALARLYADTGDEAGRARRERYLEELVELAPANLFARLRLIETLVRDDKPDEALGHMEEIRRQIPEFPAEAQEFYDAAIRWLRASRADEALTPTLTYANLLRVTGLYRAGIVDLEGPGAPFIGFPILTFNEPLAAEVRGQEAVLEALRFTDATALAGLDVLSTRKGASVARRHLAVGDYDGDGDQDLYVGSENASFLFRNDAGILVDVTAEAGIRAAPGAEAAIFADYDNDGHLDLYIVGDGPNTLLRNAGDATFRDVSRSVGVADPAFGHTPLFVDVDHDGDLDLYVATATSNRLYRNNGDGRFVELAERIGIAGGAANSRDAAFGDFDGDGDIDLFVANEDAGNVLYSNLRQSRFADVTAASGVSGTGGSGAVAVGDYDNDGFLDLFVASLVEGGHALYRNRRDGTFERDRRPAAMFRALSAVAVTDAVFFDFDNDGWLDLLVVGEATDGPRRGVFLFRNAAPGRFEDLSSLLPADLVSGWRATVMDYEEDGDLDVLIASPNGGVRLLRNDGGNGNRYLKIQLVGLRTGSGKNNHFGIGAKVEVEAGGLRQMRVVTEPVTHFGLGQEVRADIVRIVWTNGVPQNLFFPVGDQKLVEEQTLKGSCPFLYAWNGRAYEFVTDVMWHSALGMPLGIMARGTGYAYAPPNASQEYLRIPGEALRPKNGVYSLQFTGELWETAYADEVKLLVVDHPDSVDIYLNERFVSPGPASLRIYQVAHKRTPVAATDDRGNDVLPAIRDKDDVYVSDQTPTKYQGITETHDLILDLGEVSNRDTVTLLLNGWIFPTDASINVAMSQSGHLGSVPPYAQVMDRGGKWHTVIQNIGFPAGKNKFVVVDLAGKFLSDDSRVRIRTNMEIYWDYVLFTTGVTRSPSRRTVLAPTSADLHYRGFSHPYRKGGRYGPHWFDYASVSTKPKWITVSGLFTRYGDVLPLLLEADDKYVIFGAGDEITVEFDAERAPILESGWTRDFILYTDNWVKDADLNTAEGQTVAPLPFHGMSRYPYGPGQSYPTDEDHQAYLRSYNTRRVPPPNRLAETRRDSASGQRRQVP